MSPNTPMDGLALLGQQRQKATQRPTKTETNKGTTPSARRTLQPRHPAPAKPVSPEISEPNTPSDGSEGNTTTTMDQATPTGSIKNRGEVVAEPLIRSTLYLDGELDAWIQRVADLGRSTTPRIDISRSAIVRYALEQLQAASSVEAIFTELASRATESVSRGGRKRV